METHEELRARGIIDPEAYSRGWMAEHSKTLQGGVVTTGGGLPLSPPPPDFNLGQMAYRNEKARKGFGLD